MTSVMMRVSPETRDCVLRVAAEDFGGVSADEALRRLLDEHWRAGCVAAVARDRAADPAGWASYVREADEWDRAAVPLTDPWDDMARADSE